MIIQSKNKKCRIKANEVNFLILFFVQLPVIIEFTKCLAVSSWPQLLNIYRPQNTRATYQQKPLSTYSGDKPTKDFVLIDLVNRNTKKHLFCL